MSVLKTFPVVVALLAALGGGPAAITHASADLAPATSVRAAGELASARATLDALASRYRLLDGVTVRIAPTPEGKQAVAYYTRGQIVIDPAHTATIDDILAHEVWHVIDWRDNGRLDWGEYLPPADVSAYRRS